MPWIGSEVEPLGTVLVHRPGLELRRITPDTKDELLFDELVWVDRAAAEHDAFVEVIRGSGAEALYVTDLLADVLADSEIAASTIEQHVPVETFGPRLADRVRSYLGGLPVGQLVEHLIAGVTVEEAGAGSGLVGRVHGPTELVVAPLPNMLFTRDSSVWIGSGVVLCPMHRVVRRRETDLLRLIYAEHPRFGGADVWFGAEPVDHFPATVEGGDVLVLSDTGLALGISERSTPSGAEALATRLFTTSAIERILAVELPRARSTMHLDTVATMVDRDVFLLYPQIRQMVRTYRVTPAQDGGIHVEEGGPLRDELAWAAGLDEVRIVEPELGSVQAEREQWNDANNTFAVRPGEVVAYERNVATNAVLEEAGIVVHRIPSYELPRGRGGPRCMTCPIERGQRR